MFGVGQGYQGDTVFFRTKCGVTEVHRHKLHNSFVSNCLTKKLRSLCRFEQDELTMHISQATVRIRAKSQKSAKQPIEPSLFLPSAFLPSTSPCSLLLP